MEDEKINPPTSPKEELAFDNEAFESNGNIKKDSDKLQPGDEDYFEDLDEEEGLSSCSLGILRVQNKIRGFYTKNASLIKLIIWLLAFAVLLGFCAYALYRDFKRAVALFVFIVVFGVLFGIYAVRRLWGDKIYDCCCEPMLNSPRFPKVKRIIVGLIVVALAIGAIAVTIYFNIDTPRNLISVAGIFVYCLLLFIFSYNPARVQWRAVFGGLMLQFIFALVILRTTWGYDAFYFIGKQLEIFFGYTDAGSKFVFGDAYTMHFFAFKVLPVVIFFSSAISVLYYLGVMQVVIRKVAFVMRFVMGTTAGESLTAAGNIFVGQTEAPLLIRPILRSLTRSEIHAVMTGGFATIAGSVMATYILFGVPANHLLSASVMSAPAALAMAKLFYPETQRTKTSVGELKMESGGEHNVIQALANGATIAVQLVANIAANLIAFLATLEFLNAVLMWFGGLCGLEPPEYEPFTFQFICSYVLWPFAYLMGADFDDCRKVATLLGIKTFINEFVAYQDLAVLINNRKDYDSYMISTNYTGGVDTQFNDVILTDLTPPQTLTGGFMTIRSEVIATYALCGFANFGSIGIMLGGLGPMAPTRRSDMAKVVVRAMIAGNVACFLTACIAGILYDSSLEK